MATIGTFNKAANGEYVGDIMTLSVQAKGVRIAPEENPPGENAPTHRVFIGRSEIGAAWAKRSNEGCAYIGLKLDDPSFPAPIFAKPLRRRSAKLQPDLVAAQSAQRRLSARNDPARMLGGIFPRLRI